LLYTSTITTAALRLRETRLVADLLLTEPDPLTWRQRIVEDNLLQLRSPESARRIAALLRARLEPMGPELWRMVRDGPRDLAVQATLAGAIRQSRLLGDFMDLALREQWDLFAKALGPGTWTAFVAGCRGRDPEMPQWRERTVRGLRNTVYEMLAEAGYLRDTRTLVLQNVFVDPQLAALLRVRGERPLDK